MRKVKENVGMGDEKSNTKGVFSLQEDVYFFPSHTSASIFAQRKERS